MTEGRRLIGGAVLFNVLTRASRFRIPGLHAHNFVPGLHRQSFGHE